MLVVVRQVFGRGVARHGSSWHGRMRYGRHFGLATWGWVSLVQSGSVPVRQVLGRGPVTQGEFGYGLVWLGKYSGLVCPG